MIRLGRNVGSERDCRTCHLIWGSCIIEHRKTADVEKKAASLTRLSGPTAAGQLLTRQSKRRGNLKEHYQWR